MENHQHSNTVRPTEDFISIRELLQLCKERWHWFLLSLLLALGSAVIFLQITPPMYTRSAELLVKENVKGYSFSQGTEQIFADMGLVKANTNVRNEILSIRSLDNLYEVVRRLELDINYFTEGKFHRLIAYGTSLPLKVSFIDIPEEASCSFTLECSSSGMVSIYDISLQNEGAEYIPGTVIRGKLSDTLSTPMGRMSVSPSPHYRKDKGFLLYVNRIPAHIVTRNYSSQLKAELSEEKTTVIRLSLKDRCPQRAEDILNAVIDVYNENWVRDRNRIAVSTSRFIDSRLAVIEKELGLVDEDISSFKSEHLVPDIEIASSLYMKKNSATDTRLVELNNQLYMARYIQSYLADKGNENQLLPANSGVGSIPIEEQINDYNKQLLRRNGLQANSSSRNPLVVDMDRNLEALRKAIGISINNQVVTLKTGIQSLQESEKKTTSKISDNPKQEKYLLSVERQQKVKEALYLYLLQKREENELSQAFTSYNTRVVSRPNGSLAPTFPVKADILLIALAAGLLVPILILFLAENMDTRIRGCKDLKRFHIPVLGVIPLFNGKKRKGFRLEVYRGKPIVVEEGKKDIANEAFRILRTHLELMGGRPQGCDIIAVASFTSGCGKSFLTMNLAMSLAIGNKKVLVIDCDMRNAGCSAYINSPHKGLSGWLAGEVRNMEDVIYSCKGQKNMDVLPAGEIPSNPTELLGSGRMETLVRNVGERYDYVFLNCPPTEGFADALIIGGMADRTIFVVRAGITERDMPARLMGTYRNGEFRNISFILNGSERDKGHYTCRQTSGY